MTSTVTYMGDLRTECFHHSSQTTILSDAPVDNQGNGAAFSPTDQVATALASCMLTIMGIKARDLNIDLKGTRANVTKTMGSHPRRIIKIDITIQFQQSWDTKTRQLLEKVAENCPVHHSIHPDIEKEIQFVWS